MNRIAIIAGLVVSATIVVIGCRAAGESDREPAAPQTAAPSPAGARPMAGDGEKSQPFADARHHFATVYPAGWTTRNDPENVLTADAPHDQGGQPELSIAVPDLGRHLPGMVPLGLVQNGYVKDARDRLKNVKLSDERDVQIAGVPGRRFTLTGTAADGSTHVIDAEIFYRDADDMLYVVTGETSSNTTAEEIHKVVDAVDAAWQWK